MEKRIIQEKKIKITRIMLNIVNAAPIIGIIVFAILFKFFLTDRLEERILHSMTTFLLWMFASLFYIIILSRFGKAKKMIVPAMGMLAFLVMAIVVTPLDRYVNLVFVRSHLGSYLAVGIMLIIFYVVSLRWRKRVEGRYKYFTRNK